MAVVVLMATLAACAPAPGGGSGGPRVWQIQAGSHEASGTSVVLRTSDVLDFNARFDGSAQYSTVDPANQLDINKLRGFSDCGEHHHTASARFGWRWNADRIELFAYTYVAGHRQSALLGAVQPGDWHEYRLEATGSDYLFTLDGVTTIMPRGCVGGGRVKYELWPYFGGDETAPHTISIELDERPT
jgi:hypothetical protein